MIKWFAYIVLLLVFTPRLSSAKKRGVHSIFNAYNLRLPALIPALIDTSAAKKAKRQQEQEEKKIKEIAKARRQPKPEKIDAGGDASSTQKTKPKRQRRPEGLERPPEIPRRSGGG